MSKDVFFCAFASSLPQFRPSDCEATLEKKRLLSSRPDMYLQKVMDLKGSLFWCLFQLISKSSKHSNIQVSQTVLTADARCRRTGTCGRIRHAAVGPDRGPCRGGSGIL